ncbi:hypothetical protein BLA6860_04424 [Burkholderia lata]|uniref:hypothetical protein n=1 Tax=Burkholderia lata (strain ATCC 17760 / DSM 23089 / LMG 22485 / NCIMB 9086 / R18194 / 383) TaxID=482957 RepID=UPI0014547D0E|nr:hypothetical protein [Burkholderia lata]VWB92913.1 hypothetical protein BLA6860_04424 [Burkholderia lata]
MKQLVKILAALSMLMYALNCAAFVLTTYSKGISVKFEEGKFELSAHEQSRLIKLIEHQSDFVNLNVFLVIAHGDKVSDDANRDFQAMLAGARANAINSFYAEHAASEFHGLIRTFTEPIKRDSQIDQAGRAEVVIEGFCKPGNDAVCGEHWPPSQKIERE